MLEKLPLPVALTVVAAIAGCGSSKPPVVSVSPLPSSRAALPQSQISFRGAPASALRGLVVRGSSSGAHDGVLRADADGAGASFLPRRPFLAGERVTVTTKLSVIGGRHGSYSFSVAHPAAPISGARLSLVPGNSADVARFHSRPDLQPPTVTINGDSSPADGDIFLAPQNGPRQNGPLILDPLGRAVWFRPYAPGSGLTVTDFRVQDLYGQPVLTWWQGYQNQGNGRGQGVIFDQHYRRIATVHAANGLSADLHEFLITPAGDAYVTAVSPVSVAGVSKPVIDAVVQEIEMRTGLVLFEWHALDHVPLADSTLTPRSPGHAFDAYHINSVWPQPGGNLVISMRNTSAVYEIDRRTGRVIWTVGGKHPSFRMGPGTSLGFQHDAIGGEDGTLTLFDNGGGPPRVHPYSRGIRIRLDARRTSASLLGQYSHRPPKASDFDGNLQPLPGGDAFLGWGQQPYFSQYTPAGNQDFDARFNAAVSSYRAYRFQWIGTPQTSPAVAAIDAGATTNVYVSWNGATEVAGWRVLGGAAARSLRALASVATHGFETRLTIPRQRYVGVQALDDSGHVLATSGTVRAGSVRAPG